ncbi:MAG: alanine--tRNA ligase, partial [Candidatus Thorarchaeota archaeon]
ETLVNEIINQDLEVNQQFLPYDEAIEKGALAFFKENYGETVSVYSVGDFSMELCGGPHVEHTGVLKKFRIVKQKSIGTGLIRLRAILED